MTIEIVCLLATEIFNENFVFGDTDFLFFLPLNRNF